jgi:hypothetical protein
MLAVVVEVCGERGGVVCRWREAVDFSLCPKRWSAVLADFGEMWLRCRKSVSCSVTTWESLRIESTFILLQDSIRNWFCMIDGVVE